MKRTILIIVAFLMLFSVPGASRAQVVDRVVAVVNNEVITLYELNTMVSNYMNKIGRSYGKEDREKILAESRMIMLNRMIDDMLIEQNARKAGIVVREEDVMAAISDMLARKKMKMEDLKEAVAKEGSTMEIYKEEAKSHLMKIRLAQKEVRSKIAVSDEEIGNYYSLHRDVYEGKESVRLKQILLAVPKEADEETKEKIRTQAMEILEKLKKGESFELMAGRYSRGPEAQAGGDLGFVEKGTMLPTVDEAAFGMKDGELSNVIETPMGFLILKVTDRRGKGSKPLTAVREEIKEEITNEKMEKKLQDWVQDLRKKSFVEIRL
jgi:peptidyl-prolyl cis-trans isomerase SurA